MIYRVPDTIAADGSREVSKELNAWIANVNSFGVLYFPDDSVYWVDDTINVSNKNSLGIIGGRFVRRNQIPASSAVVRGRAHFKFTACDVICCIGMHVKGQANTPFGYNAGMEAQHGFSFLDCVDVDMVECSVDDVQGDALNFAGGSSDIHVSRFKSGNVMRDSVSLTNANNITFEACEFGASFRSGVDVEPNRIEESVTGILFDGCSWKSHRLGWLSAGTETAGGTVDGVTMRNCVDRALTVVANCDRTKGRRSNFTIQDCVGLENVGGPSGAVMMFSNTGGVVNVTGNRVVLQAGRTPPMRVARFDDWTTANAQVTYQGNTADLG